MISIEDKIIAFYVKLKTEDRGPTAKMVLEPILKEYEDYFKITKKPGF